MANHNFNRWLEGQAQGLRAKCSLSTFAPLNPFDLAARMGVQVFTPGDIEGLDPAVLSRVLDGGANEWDAATLQLPDESHVVIMNPTRGRERQHASLMEELAHIHLKHRPTQLRTVYGIVLREWNQTRETQAYWLGAAALVPERVMKGAVTRQMTVEALAAQCGVSRQLIEFRERMLGLRLVRPSLAES